MLFSELEATRRYCTDLLRYQRLATREVAIGDVPLGGANPIRIQSMTTTDTMDTVGTVEQTLRMVAAGCEYVRITAPSKKEAENLAVIKAELRKRGCTVPLVADIHFTPNAAEAAARIVEKVRVNPGNYADKKKFEHIEYTDASYQDELERIDERFRPLIAICKEYGTAMRIGTNHGSLSDRILSRYGDTPEGMVESALEFARICEAEGYHQFVFSMKASNPQVMVQAYRLLAARMLAGATRYVYPLHVGVTEAGDGQDGRIKSAMGIGTLLADGLGDTIRVSLTEPPEVEMPVARIIRDHFIASPKTVAHPPLVDQGLPLDPYAFNRRATRAVFNFGGEQLPRVISDFSADLVTVESLAAVGHTYWPEPDKWAMAETGVDFVYAGPREVPFMLPTGVKALYDAELWSVLPDADRAHAYPVFASLADYAHAERSSEVMNLVVVGSPAVLTTEANLALLKAESTLVLVLDGVGPYPMLVWRNALAALINHGIACPVVLRLRVEPATQVPEESADHCYQLAAASDLGLPLVDGLVDGLWLTSAPGTSKRLTNDTAFGLLQAARLRTTKTEYISCPSCGRTLFDLQETTALIRARTEHLKGVKIGIMGCIVNGPGEMADADYGYVGAGPGIISLWKGKTQVKAKVPTAQAVDELIALIRDDGRWVEVG
jgi:(E)-4-hydroxy-3-methylbut-2-enyl-diphosphate synthase